MKWESKTVAELRAAAKKAGIKGYSHLNKEQLVRAVSRASSRPAKRKTGPDAARRRATTKHARTAPAVSPTPVAPPPPPLNATPAEWETVRDEEMQIEDTKFRTTPAGTTIQQPAFPLPGEEDLDLLPPIAMPMLALLPQKPGVLHAYWVLPPDHWRPQLHLRLARVIAGRVQVLHEFVLPASRGHWYFHVSDSLRFDDLYAELGRYDAQGRFEPQGPRSRAHLPNLYPAGEGHYTQLFRELYLRAGGIEREGRLLWPGAVSSFSSR